MSRLIDADELIKCLDYCAWNDATEVVNAQPTAYDIEKVTEDLRKASMIINTDENNIKYAIEENMAVYIVKNGGIF